MEKKTKEQILEELGGLPEELYDELVASFIENAQNQFIELEKAISGNDSVSISKIAHSLKGSSANLRLGNIQELASFVEKSAKEGLSLNEFQGKIGELINAVLELKKQHDK